ncbi:MAG TPA: hypothetical protein VF678_11615 [bacterium]
MNARQVGFLVGVVILLGGCADADHPAEMGIPFNVAFVDYIQLNFTARREVTNWFGNPLARVRLADSEGRETDNVRYAYLHGSAQGNLLSTEYLEVEFDTDGLVAGIYFAQADDGPPDM